MLDFIFIIAILASLGICIAYLVICEGL